MAKGKVFTPWLTQWLTSHTYRELRYSWFELKRRLAPSLDTVIYYHRVDDPYCLLMLQMIPRLLQDFQVNIEIKILLDLPETTFPEPERQLNYALADAKRLANFHRLAFPDNPSQPLPEEALKATGIILKHKDRPKLMHLITEVTDALWGCSTTTFQSALKRYGTVSDLEVKQYRQLAKTELMARGHYNSAMLYYGGEWYWGLDRLAHLVDRLNKPRYRRRDTLFDYQRQYRHITQGVSALRARPKQVKPLDFYFSFRSPYSYLAVARVYKLAELYKVPVIAKPILPLVERGTALPKVKLRYMLRDAKREADKYHIPFGKIYDPLGVGVNNAMALFFYAQQQAKEKEFMTTALSAIWAQGLDLSNTNTLKTVVERSNLDWQQAQHFLDDKQWLKKVERYQKELKAFGLWDVPAYKYGTTILWGQDRLWALEQLVLAGAERNS